MSATEQRTRPSDGKPRRERPPKPPTTLRQLGQQVAQGRRVTLVPPLAEESEQYVGYIGGWDPPTSPTANYLLFVPTEQKDSQGRYIVKSYLVPQAGTLVEMHEESTFDNEPARDVLTRKTEKFRNYVIHSVLANRGQDSGESA